MKSIIFFLAAFLFLATVPSLVFAIGKTGLDCSQCDCAQRGPSLTPYLHPNNDCESLTCGSCYCEYTNDPGTGGTVATARPSECVVGDGSCSDDSQCNYSCGKNAFPKCMEGVCTCQVINIFELDVPAWLR